MHNPEYNHEFILKPSRQYCIFFALLVGLSLIIFISLPLAWLTKGMGLFIQGSYSSYLFWRYVSLKSSRSIIGIKKQSDTHWLLIMPNGSYSAKLRGDSTITRWVSILRFNLMNNNDKANNKEEKYIFWPVTCVIFRDSLATDYYRKCVVLLRG
ncbi:MAG TPA: protein YgfX [Gammaproteobacteria bacterium]|nr:protein YgfX [Gammaproteobacteria bacterium]